MDSATKIYPVVYITDDNYAMPTAVSVTSLYYSKNDRYEYRVYIICTGVSDENLDRLKALSKSDFEVTLILEDNRFDGIRAAGVEHVSGAALFKFELPNIFSQYEKILYLDGDTLVCKDLAELFETDIEDRYAAVVKDYKTTTYKIPQLVKLNIAHKHKFYWNSGMMLLNLKNMRRDNLSQKLYDYRMNGVNIFMDQDAFNVVFEENVRYVSFYYNTLTVIPEQFDRQTIADYYDLEPYDSFKQIIGRSYILHLTGQYKPWEHLMPVVSDIYTFYYTKSPYRDIPLQLLDNDRLEHRYTDSVIPIVYNIDNSNAKIASVSIASLIYNKRPETKYAITIICNVIDPSRIVRLKSISAENVSINIIRPDYSTTNFADQMGNFYKVSLISRLGLAEILPDYDKIIYVSPNTLVLKDLTDLYCIDIENKLGAAVPDFRQMFKKHPQKLGLRNKAYYNTNVMLYNLKYLREHGDVSTELKHYLKYGLNFFEYQDALNVCAGGEIECISYYFNALDNIFDLNKNALAAANMIGVKRFASRCELFSRAYIVSLAGPNSPWKNINPVFSDIFLRYFMRSVFCDYPFFSNLDEEVENIRNNPNYTVACENQTDDSFYNTSIRDALIPQRSYTEYVYAPPVEWSEEEVYRKYSDITADGLNHKPRDKRIVVSLTTIPFRIEAASLVIAIMMHQTLKPDEIVINLGDELFKDVQLPELLLKEEECGVKINFCRDLFCHTKYFHTMQMFPDDIVITVDDDILYNETLIEELYNSYLEHPDCISSMRAHLITFDKNGNISPYTQWKYCCADYIGIPSHKLLATGVGGVLYPPHIISGEVFNVDSILEVCPRADDLWLKVMEILSDVKVLVCKRTEPLIFIGETQKVGLCYDNVAGGKNDEQLQCTIERYNQIDDSTTIIGRLIDDEDNIRPIIEGSHEFLSIAAQFAYLTRSSRDIANDAKRANAKLSEALARRENAEYNEIRKRLAQTERKLNEARKENQLIRISLSFRIGRFVTWLPRKIVGFFTHNKNR